MSLMQTITQIKTKGFSLIELLIVVVILGLTSSFGIPAFSGWIANAQTRTFAEVLQNNIRLTQAEAVRSGRQVQFFLTAGTPTLAASTSTSGKNWGIQSMSLTSSSTPDTFVQGGSISAGNAMINIAASSGVLQFNSIGRLTTPAQSALIDISNANGDRPLRITVSAAGAIRMCDPSKLRADAPYGC
jgi:type IV fimbrial biogenesis protein FimT